MLLIVVAALSYIVQMVIVPKSVTIPIVIVIAAIIGVYWYINEYKSNLYTKVLPFVKYFGPFYLWVVLSVFWTVNPDYSFALIRALLAFEFGCFVGIFAKNKLSMEKVLWGFVVGGVISTAVVLYNQYMLIGKMRLGHFIYGSAMEYSGGIVVSAYACIMLYRLKKDFVFLLLLFFFITICALSGSRTAIVFPIIFWTIVECLYSQNIKKMVLIAICFGVAGYAFIQVCLKIPIFYDVVGHRIETILSDKNDDGSYLERSEMKHYGILYWQENPIMGLGVNGFAKRYALVNKPVYSHCDFTEILSCFGIIGALLFYVPFFKLMLRKGTISMTRMNYWQSFFLAFLFLLVIQLYSSIHFMSIKTIMMLSLISNYSKNAVEIQ